MKEKTVMRRRAQELRRNATKEEGHLWYDFLRTYPIQFQRQRLFERYIVDFYCDRARLVVELDGSQHYDGEGLERDVERTTFLERQFGLQVLRFSNLDINQNFEGVCTAIHLAVGAAYPSSVATAPRHLPQGEGSNGSIMKQVTIYTDGACSGNPGPGGWGAILQYGTFKKELSGGETPTTNNRMELTGAITALEALKEPCAVDLYSDSKYVIDGLQKGWAKGWKAKGWIKADKKPALNPDLWDRLLALYDYHTVTLHWVKGHAENAFNNRCDELAVAESQKRKT